MAFALFVQKVLDFDSYTLDVRTIPPLPLRETKRLIELPMLQRHPRHAFFVKYESRSYHGQIFAIFASSQFLGGGPDVFAKKYRRNNG
jgi:hypothetical protein